MKTQKSFNGGDNLPYEEPEFRLSWRTRISFIFVILAVIYFFSVDAMPYSILDDLALIIVALLVFVVFAYIDYNGGEKSNGKRRKKRS